MECNGKPVENLFNALEIYTLLNLPNKLFKYHVLFNVLLTADHHTAVQASVK